MIRLTIPNDDEKYLIELFKMDQAKRNEFLDKIKTDNNIDDITVSFQEITHKSPDMAKGIIRVLFSIYDSFDTSFASIEDFTSALLDAFTEFEQAKQLIKSDACKKYFKGFFIEILSLHDKFGIKAKVLRLMPQHQHLFIGSELYSDIRPVFTHGEIKTPSAAIILHSLKITYQEGTETKDFYLGLSEDDLRQLNYIINRAIEKHECLKLMIEKSNMKCLRMERE